MSKLASELIQIVRNVTGRIDDSDPQFTDPIILGYINDFYTLEMGQEMRINERMTWWEFMIDTTTANPLPVDLSNPFGLTIPNLDKKFTTIGPLAYIDGFSCWWYQDPGQFYARWPETQTYQKARPTDILYYDQSLTFRNPPDKQYEVKINAYQVEVPIDLSGFINPDYVWRYICYGAARDIFSDYGELDLWERYEPVFRRYKALVWSRTNQQNISQRPQPEF